MCRMNPMFAKFEKPLLKDGCMATHTTKPYGKGPILKPGRIVSDVHTCEYHTWLCLPVKSQSENKEHTRSFPDALI